MLGDRGHQRRRGGVRILPAQQIDGAAAADQISHIGGGAAVTGDAAAADVVLEEQAHRLLHRGGRVAGCPVIAVQRTVQQPVPIRGGMRVLAENLGRLARDRGGLRDPQHMVQGAAGQSCGVEERLDHLRRLSGIETGGVVAIPTGDRTLDGAGGERLGPPLRHHRIHTARHRIPHQLRQASGQPNGSSTTQGRSSPDRTAKLSSRSSTLVKVTNAAPGAPRSAGASRSRVLPLPCGPMTPVVRPTAPTAPAARLISPAQPPANLSRQKIIFTPVPILSVQVRPNDRTDLPRAG